ncbi:unnamed protein product [Effrenium voratum]|nr:unnamed protein product [Effrenium voratum]
MAHFRRFNENNVDLNRNCLQPDQFEKLKEDRIASIYGSFDPLFNPTEEPGVFYRNVGVWFRMAYYVASYGIGYIKTAMVAATYSQEKGIFYGGKKLEKSHVLLRDFFQRFAEVEARKVAWVDVHTGLGPTGVDVLLGSGKDYPKLQELFPKIAGESDGPQNSFGLTVDEVLKRRCGEGAELEMNGAHFSASQSAGYEFSVGILSSDWVTTFFAKNSGQVLQVAQEFGTLGNLSVARALMLENYGWNHDRQNHDFWRTYTRDAFYVRTGDWKARVLRRGDEVFRKLSAAIPSA